MIRIVVAGTLGVLALSPAAHATKNTSGGSQPSDSEVINIEGVVPLSCTVDGTSLIDPEPVDLTSRGEQTLTGLNYVCNAAGGFQREISSTNRGMLRRSGGDASSGFPYILSHGGSYGLSFDAQSMHSPIVTSLAGSEAFITGQTGSLRVTIGPAQGPAFAGIYRDTITVTVTPNS